jgi:hypothetical protein
MAMFAVRTSDDCSSLHVSRIFHACSARDPRAIRERTARDIEQQFTDGAIPTGFVAAAEF